MRRFAEERGAAARDALPQGAFYGGAGCRCCIGLRRGGHNCLYGGGKPSSLVTKNDAFPRIGSFEREKSGRNFDKREIEC